MSHCVSHISRLLGYHCWKEMKLKIIYALNSSFMISQETKNEKNKTINTETYLQKTTFLFYEDLIFNTLWQLVNLQ